MSVLAIGDLLFSDLLSELNIKPWWEKFRGYCFAASVASALFITYIILLSTTTIDCIPLIGRNMSSKLEFSITQALFINNYCSKEIPWYVNYTGIIFLGCTIFILVASIWWLHIPGVISAFRTFAVFGKDIEDLKLTSKQLGNYCSKVSKPSVSEEARELQNIRKTCNLLWKYENSVDVDLYYFIRNVILLLITIASAATSMVMYTFLDQDATNFECSLDRIDEYKIYGTIGVMRYFCSYNTSKRLIPFIIFLLISLFGQVIFILISIIFKIRKIYYNKLNVRLNNLSAKASKAYKYSIFMINFWENSRLCGSGPLRNLIEYMFDRALPDMFSKMENAISENDHEIISIYSCVKKNGVNEIIKVMNTMVQRENLTTSLYDSTVNAVDQLDSIEWGEDIKNFIDCLFKKKYWQLLVHVLFIKRWTGLKSSSKRDEFQTYIKNLYINTDEIGETDLDTHKPSILHFVIEDKLRYFLMAEYYWSEENDSPSISWPYREKYVHFNGRSEPISDALKKHCYPNFSEIVGVIPIPVKVFFKYTDCSESRAVRLRAIQEIYVEHMRETEVLQNKPKEYFQYQKKLAEKLSCFKFPEWDSATQMLAAYLHSEKQWVVLVELLNAFIIPPDADANDCGVQRFNLTDIDVNGASILCYALNHPFYLGNKKIPPRIFVYTAFRYILTFTDARRNKKVMDPNIPNGECDVTTYIGSYTNADTKDIKYELLRILRINEDGNIPLISSV